MSKWDEAHTEPIHDTPAEKDVLIRAMEAAGYTLDPVESTDDHLRFIGIRVCRHALCDIFQTRADLLL